jgi:aspartyl protease family protein
MDNDSNQEDTGRLGTGMIIAAWVLALGLLALFFNNYLDNQQNPNREFSSTITNGVREVVLQRNRYGHYVASGKINNADVVFMLDTGATTISIPESVARRLNLERGFSYSVSTANGNINVYATKLDNLRLGDIVLYNLRAHINPYMEGEEILLGMSVLKKLELNQRGDTLTIRQ